MQNEWVGSWALAWILGVATPLLFGGVSRLMEMTITAMRSEVPIFLSEIIVAEKSHFSENGRYVAAPLHPRARDALSRQRVDWGTPQGFDTLGWAAPEAVRGTYTIVLREDGADVLVVGSIDLDQDGEVAHYAASLQMPVAALSPERMR